MRASWWSRGRSGPGTGEPDLGARAGGAGRVRVHRDGRAGRGGLRAAGVRPGARAPGAARRAGQPGCRLPRHAAHPGRSDRRDRDGGRAGQRRAARRMAGAGRAAAAAGDLARPLPGHRGGDRDRRAGDRRVRRRGVRGGPGLVGPGRAGCRARPACGRARADLPVLRGDPLRDLDDALRRRLLLLRRRGGALGRLAGAAATVERVGRLPARRGARPGDRRGRGDGARSPRRPRGHLRPRPAARHVRTRCGGRGGRPDRVPRRDDRRGHRVRADPRIRRGAVRGLGVGE